MTNAPDLPALVPSPSERLGRNLGLAATGLYTGGVIGTVLSATGMGLPPEEVENTYVLLISAGTVAGAFGLALVRRASWPRTVVLFIAGAVGGSLTMALAAGVGWWGPGSPPLTMSVCLVLWAAVLGTMVGAMRRRAVLGGVAGVASAGVIAAAAHQLGHPDLAGLFAASAGVFVSSLTWWSSPAARFWFLPSILSLAGVLAVGGLLAWLTPRYWPRVQLLEAAEVHRRGDVQSFSRVVFSSDGRRLLSSHAGGAWLWDLDRGIVVASWKPNEQAGITAVGFTTRDEVVCVVREENALELWDIGEGRRRARVVLRGWIEPNWKAPQRDAEQAVLSPDGRRVLYARQDQAFLRRIDFDNQSEEVFVLPLDMKPSRLAWGPDGSRPIVGCQDGTVWLWPLTREWEPPRKGQAPHAYPIRVLEVSADGRWACASSLASDLEVWNLREWTDFRNLRGLGGRLPPWLGDNGRRASFSADSSLLLTVEGNDFQRLVIIDQQTRSRSVFLHHHSILLDFRVRGVDLTLSPDGRRGATMDLAGRVRVWNLP